MFLKIIENTDLFDFQKNGNDNKYKIGIKESPNDALLPFRFRIAGGGNLTVFNLNKVKIVGDTVTIESTTDLMAHAPIPVSFVYENQLTGLASDLDDGVYYFAFSDGSFNMKSELFCCNGILVTPFGSYSSAYSSAYEI